MIGAYSFAHDVDGVDEFDDDDTSSGVFHVDDIAATEDYDDDQDQSGGLAMPGQPAGPVAPPSAPPQTPTSDQPNLPTQRGGAPPPDSGSGFVDLPPGVTPGGEAWADLDAPAETSDPTTLELAWSVMKGIGKNLPLVSILKQAYDISGRQTAAAHTALQKGQYGTAALHALGASMPGALPTAIGQSLAAMPGQSLDQLQKFRAMYEQGRYVEAAGHLFGAIPLIGTAAAGAAEEGVAAYESGDPRRMAEAAGGAGTVLASSLLPRAAVKTAQKAAAAAGAIAKERIVRVVTPQVGPGKLRLSEMAAEPQNVKAMLTEPGLTAGRVQTFAQKITAKRQAANAQLQAAYNRIPDTKTYATAPIIRLIEDKIRQLTPTGAKGQSSPSALMSERIGALKRARAELQALGKRANIDNLRLKREQWDTGAWEKETTPRAQQGADALRREGRGWRDARTALQDYMNQQEPQLRPLNADYSIWADLDRILQARTTTQRARGQKLQRFAAFGAGASGAFEGWHYAGVPGALAGLLAGPLLDHILEQGYTTKIASARALSRFADALEMNNPTAQISALRALGATSGMSKELEAALRQSQTDDHHEPQP
jgi:hypothetical protein